jgi:hypothetical protein
MTVEITPANLDALLHEMADGKSMREVCKQDGMPTRWQIQELLRNDADFASQYARACEMRAEEVFDEMLAIADTPVIGEKTKIDKDGNVETTSGDMIEHRRLQVDARKWALARMSPKKYGDKLALGGASDLPPIETKELTDIEFARRVAFSLAAATQGDSNG